eukprot:6175396-Pleurochrysis_carterae.AAC.2
MFPCWISARAGTNVRSRTMLLVAIRVKVQFGVWSQAENSKRARDTLHGARARLGDLIAGHVHLRRKQAK